MDDGHGKFIELETQKDESQNDVLKLQKILEDRHPDHGGWFREGEELEIRGSRFRVKSVKPTELRLKLLPRNK